jgi:hypothetical protein
LACSIFAQNAIENRIKLLEIKLYNLNQVLKLKEEKLNHIKRIYVLSLIKANIIKENISFLNEREDYYKNKERYELLMKVNKKIQKKLEDEINEIKRLKRYYEARLEENKKLKEVYYTEKMKVTSYSKDNLPKRDSGKDKGKPLLFDPITEVIISPGKFKRKVRPGTVIKAPFSGIVKKISFIQNSFTLTLENQQCLAFISGFSLIKVNLGEEVRAKEILGEASHSEEPENIYFELFCK